MQKLKPYKVGLVLGAFSGGWHILWSILVALGWAQPITDFIFRLHFITPFYQIGPFQLGTALGLVALTATLGFVGGCILALIWNYIAGKTN